MRDLLKSRWLFLAFLIAVAGVLRLYHFSQYIEFLDDQGRDAIVIKRILIDHDFTLLGPGTSVGNMYLGPLYYYVMVPFLALTYPLPTGPAYAIAVLGVVTTVLIYTLGKEIISERGAKIAALLYAVSPVVVRLSRFSWQPNPAPFVGLLMLWFCVSAVRGRTWRWIGVWICFAILTQLHYVALLSALPAGILFLLDMKKRKTARNIHIISVFIGILSLLAVFSPLIAFDLRHDHLIVKGFQDFFREQKTVAPLYAKIVRMIQETHGRSLQILVETLGFPHQTMVQRALNTLFVVVVVVAYALQLMKVKKEQRDGVIVLGVWIAATIFGLSAYRNVVYEHYFAFAFPAVFLLWGAALSFLVEQSHLAKKIVRSALILFVVYLFSQMWFWRTKPSDMLMFREIAGVLMQKLPPGSRYNIALLNDNREYKGMKYRYFFEVSKTPPLSQYEYVNLDRLIVIVEDKESPLKAPIFEVQQFLREVRQPKLLSEYAYNGVVRTYIFGKK